MASIIKAEDLAPGVYRLQDGQLRREPNGIRNEIKAENLPAGTYALRDGALQRVPDIQSSRSLNRIYGIQGDRLNARIDESQANLTRGVIQGTVVDATTVKTANGGLIPAQRLGLGGLRAGASVTLRTNPGRAIVDYRTV